MSEEPLTGAEPLSLRGWQLANGRLVIRHLHILRAVFAAQGRADLVRKADDVIGSFQSLTDAYAAELGPEERVLEVDDATLDEFAALFAPWLRAMEQGVHVHPARPPLRAVPRPGEEEES